jgi:tyrocidine synthetase-3
MMPTYFVGLDALPINSNGKVDRKLLPPPVDAELSTQGNYVAPQTDAEKKIAQLWRDILGVENIGIHDNFLEMGAHSLNMGAFLNRLHRELNVRIDLRDIFLSPTVYGIARLLEQQAVKQYEAIPKIGDREYYDISHAQMRLWILTQFKDAGTVYSMPMAYELTGALDVGALGKAFDALVDRHESLRTIFVVADGLPKQKILSRESAGFKLVYTDLSAEGKVLIDSAVEENTNCVFDLTRGPLVRVRVLKTDVDRYMLLLNMHHILSDGWSFRLMIHEVTILYDAFVAGRPNPLKPLEIQYKDFVYWQNDRIARVDEEFWLNKTSHYKPFRLPYDIHDSKAGFFEGSFEEIHLGDKAVEILSFVALQNNTTVSNVLLTVVNVLLYNISGQSEVAVGMVVSNRTHAALEDLIGFFVNMVLIQQTVDEDAEFSDLLRTLTDTVHRALEHQNYPFDLLVDKLASGSSDLNRTIVGVAYGFQDLRKTAVDVKSDSLGASEQVQVESFTLKTNTAKFDVSVMATLYDEGVTIKMEYGIRFFRQSSILRWLNYIEKFIMQLGNR